MIKDDIRGLSEAALVLTPESDKDAFNDGLLTASEIADLSLNADMVILSACNTARYGLAEFGGEVQGIATAFAIAGVPRTLATLWSIDSVSARDLMTRVFPELNTGPAGHVADALQTATNSVLTAARGTPSPLCQDE